MKISIITPSFNQAKLIRKTMESVKAQTYDNREHIIFDGGSSDGTELYLKEYAREAAGVRVFIEPDRGQAHAINKGLAVATGDILTWLNSDDYYHDPGALQAVADYFKNNPQVDLLYGRGLRVDPAGNILTEAYVHPPGTDFRLALQQALGLLQPAVFFRRKVYEAVGGLDEKYNLQLDYEYWIRIAARGFRFGFLDRLICRAVVHDDAKSTAQRQQQLNECLHLVHENFGYVPYQWISRYAEFFLTAKDHKINAKITLSEQQKKEKPVIERHLLKRFAATEKARAVLSANRDRSPYKETARALEKYDLLKERPRQLVVTSFDSGYFQQGLNLIASLHRTSLDSVDKILVYPLRLSKEERHYLESLEKVELVDYPEQAKAFFPEYLEPKHRAYKQTAIRADLPGIEDGDLVLWMDAGLAALQDVQLIFDLIAAHDFFITDHDDKAGWPFYNIMFTHHKSQELLKASSAELLAPHLCSALVGYRRGGRYQEIIEEAYRIGQDKAVVVWPKTLKKEEQYLPQLSASEKLSKRQLIEGAIEPASITRRELQALFPYLGHRTQSIYSILVARYKAPFFSAKKYRRSNDLSSRAAHVNWEIGAEEVDKQSSRYNLAGIDSEVVVYHHRGIYHNLEGLKEKQKGAFSPGGPSDSSSAGLRPDKAGSGPGDVRLADDRPCDDGGEELNAKPSWTQKFKGIELELKDILRARQEKESWRKKLLKELDLFSQKDETIAAKYSAGFLEGARFPLVTSFYENDSPEALENNLAIAAANCRNPFIAGVHVFYEGDPDRFDQKVPASVFKEIDRLRRDQKLKFIAVRERPSYKDLFEYANRLPAATAVIANSDICFDVKTAESIALDMQDREPLLCALTRWNRTEQGVFIQGASPRPPWPEIPLDQMDRRDKTFLSFDAYIFKTPIEIPACAEKILVGTYGCDPALVASFKIRGLAVCNPCLKYTALHIDERPKDYAGAAISGHLKNNFQAVRQELLARYEHKPPVRESLEQVEELRPAIFLIGEPGQAQMELWRKIGRLLGATPWSEEPGSQAPLLVRMAVNGSDLLRHREQLLKLAGSKDLERTFIEWVVHGETGGRTLFELLDEIEDFQALAKRLRYHNWQTVFLWDKATAKERRIYQDLLLALRELLAGPDLDDQGPGFESWDYDIIKLAGGKSSPPPGSDSEPAAVGEALYRVMKKLGRAGFMHRQICANLDQFRTLSEQVPAGYYLRCKTFWGAPMILVPKEKVSGTIYSSGLFEPDLSAFLVEFLKPGQVVIDIGAHLGYFSMLAAELVGARGRVISFEPTPSTTRLLSENTAPYPQVTVVPRLAWNQKETIEFKTFDSAFSAFNTAVSDRLSDEKRAGTGCKIVKVEAVPLDHYCQEGSLEPDLVKIDAESSELQVLQGMVGLMETARPVMAIEVGDLAGPAGGDIPLSKDLLSFMHGYDYVAMETVGFKLKTHSPHDHKYDYDNIIMMPKEKVVTREPLGPYFKGS